MQLFRTASNRYEKTLRRKLTEIIGTWALQRKFSKVEILRAYLEMAYFGTELYGAENTAITLYHRSPVDLSTEEAAHLAAMLVYPKPRIASANWQTKISRRANYGRLIFRSRPKGSEQLWS